ncbi:helix-turn-helix domain-containing protein [Acidilobus sp.]|uniref:helix-turn-helix domain-containing protein n=1 Tax=Acidilobus sp. TaxID=1872109 RepID=UPI003CFC7312
MSGDVNDIETTIRSLLGVNKYEAAAYLALLKLGKAKPQDIAKESSVPSQRIYDVLRSLESMGLVTEFDGVYQPIEPRQAINAIAESEIMKSLEKANRLRELGDLLSRTYGTNIREGARVSLVRGLNNVFGAAMSYGSSCNSRPIFMAFKVFDRLAELLPELRKLVASLPSGALVIVPKGSLERYRQLADEFKRLGIEFVESEAAFIDLMVSCNAVIIGLPHGDDAVAVVVVDKDFSEAMYRRLSEFISR